MLEAFGQDAMYDDLDDDRAGGCIRDVEHAYSKDGGLAVLYGNLAEDGCIVKTAGVDESILVFTGPARVFESQEAAVQAILLDQIKPGDVVNVGMHRGDKDDMVEENVALVEEILMREAD